MSKCKDCKDSVKNTCFDGKTSAKCIDYYGCVSENSELDKDKCYDFEEIVCESFNLIDDLFERIDVSGLGCCIDYTVEDESVGLTLKDVFISFEGILCDHEDRLNKLDEPTSVGCGTTDECGNPISKCVTFEYAGFGTGDELIDNSYNTFKKIGGVNYSDLIYKSNRKGKAKVTVEVYSDNSGVLNVGLSKNNFEPNNTPLSRSEMSTGVLTTVFIEDVDKNDMLSIKFQHVSGGATIKAVKMIVELI